MGRVVLEADHVNTKAEQTPNFATRARACHNHRVPRLDVGPQHGLHHILRLLVLVDHTDSVSAVVLGELVEGGAVDDVVAAGGVAGV